MTFIAYIDAPGVGVHNRESGIRPAPLPFQFPPLRAD
jgi:hypothetical protein